MRAVDDNMDGIAKFMCHVMGRFVSGTVAEHEDVLVLGDTLWGITGKPNKVVVRRCYKTRADEVLSWLYDDPRGGECLVGGTKGIGKSVFGLYLVIRLLRLGKIVVYEQFGVKLLLISAGAESDQLTEVARALAASEYAELPTSICDASHVFLLEDDLYAQLITKPGLTHVLDLGTVNGQLEHDLVVNLDGSCRKVVISSPNADKLRPFLEERATSQLICIDLWTLEELQEHLTSLSIVYDQKKNQKIRFMDAEELVERFSRFGGVPRTVLELPQDKADRLMNKALESAKDADIISALNTRRYASLPKNDLRSCLIHSVPTPDAKDFTNVIASPWVAVELLRKFRKDSTFRVKAFLEAASGLRYASVLRGHFLEGAAHEALLKGQGAFTIADLEVVPPTFTPIKHTLPTLQEVEFEGNTLDNLPRTFAQLQYGSPRSASFESLDSFAVVKRKLFSNRHNQGWCIVGFQMTIAGVHPVKWKGLKSVRDGILERLSGQMKTECANNPFVLVFITDHSGVFEKQSITPVRQPATPPFDVHQYALCVASVTDDVKAMFV
jgi:hypothetical protein